MAVIDQSVVRIGPDFKGFKTALRAGLKQATAGITGKVTVKVDVDPKGLAASIRTALRGINAGQTKVKLVADAAGFAASARKALAAEKLTAKVRLVTDGGGISGGSRPSSMAAEERRVQAARLTETRRGLRQQESAERESMQRRQSLLRGFKPPKLADLGSGGLRPMNLLYASLAALSPVLTAVASSAVQAGTSIVALGSAAYGGALAVTGLVAAFAGVIGALKLHSSLQKAQQGQSAKAASAEISNAGSIRNAYNSVLSAKEGVADATRSLRDAQTAEKKAITDVAKAYQDAAQKVRDLRLQLADLKVQQSGNVIDVAEAKRHQREIESDFFATDLMKQQAAQGTREAVQRGHDIGADIGKTKTELSQRTKAGLGGSPEVVDARSTVDKATKARQDAQRNLAKAVRSSAEAQRDYTDALKTNTSATRGALAQDGQLQAALKDLSPAARDLYKWITANSEQFKQYRRSVEQAILPGFLSFLKAVTDRSKGGASTIDVLVGGIIAIGRQISRTVKNLGRLASTPWFKGELVKLNKDNEAAFTNIGDAVVALAKPLMQLFVAASPLIVRFSGYLKSLAGQFATWVSNVGSANLAAWFKSAGDALAGWWKIATNLGSTLLSIFTASLPSGSNLVGRLGELTGQLAAWASSGKGQTQIQKFFGYFQNIDYGKVARLAGSLAVLMGAFKVGELAGKNPLTALFGMLAAKYPDATVAFLESVTDATVTLLSWVEKHPGPVAQMLLLVGAYKTLKGVGAIKATLGGLPGMPGGGGGTSRVATMTVTAATVNVLGGAAGVGGGGVGSGGGGGGGGTIIAGAPGAGKGGRLGRIGGKLKGALGKGGGVKAGLVGTALSIGAGLLVDPVLDHTVGKDDGKKGKKGALRGGVSGAITGAGIGATLGSVVPGVGTAVGAGAGGLVGGAVGAISGGGWWEPIQKFFTSLPGKIGGWLKGAWDAIWKWFKNLGPSIGGWVSDAWSGAVTFFTNLPGMFLDALAALPGKLAYWAGQLVGWIIVGIVKGIPALWGMLKNLAKYFWTGMLWIKDKIGAGISLALDFFAAMPGKIWGFIKTIPGKVWSGLKMMGHFVRYVVDGALKFFREMPGKAVGFIKELPNMIWEAIKAIPGFFSRMWTDIKDFFIDGIDGAIGLLNKFLSGVDSITGKFGIHIPHNIPTIGSKEPKNALGRGNPLGPGKDRTAIRSADGGRIPGYSPNSRADNIPAWLTAGEWVQPVKAVNKYGPQFMKAVQQGTYEPGFADGGLVDSVIDKVRPPFIRDITRGIYSKIPSLWDLASMLTGGKSDTQRPTGGTVSGDPNVARIAEATARAMGASEKQLIALIETGLVESTMRNLSYGDKDSVGFLQQRPSQGWGSVKQIMDPAYATRKFIQKARRVDKGTFDAGQLAQAVQGSAYPYRYGKRYADAVAILNQSAPYVAGGGGGLGATPGGRGWKWQEDVLRQAFGKNVQFYSTTGGGHVDNSWHYKGRAVDLTPSMDIFNWIKSRYGANTLELIYGPAGMGIRHGKPYDFGRALNARHRTHIHWAYRDGGMVKAEKFDTGGILNPGVTMAVNNTRRPETVRTYEQERALNAGPMRIDRRDLALLAGYIVNAIAGQHIQMDGRKVAETVRGYDYMPRGI